MTFLFQTAFSVSLKVIKFNFTFKNTYADHSQKNLSKQHLGYEMCINFNLFANYNNFLTSIHPSNDQLLNIQFKASVICLSFLICILNNNWLHRKYINYLTNYKLCDLNIYHLLYITISKVGLFSLANANSRRQENN